MTTTEQRCERTELIVNQCAHCRGLDTNAAEYLTTGYFRARRPGTCAICQDDFPAGARLARLGGLDAGSYCHAECAP